MHSVSKKWLASSQLQKVFITLLIDRRNFRRCCLACWLKKKFLLQNPPRNTSHKTQPNNTFNSNAYQTISKSIKCLSYTSASQRSQLKHLSMCDIPWIITPAAPQRAQPLRRTFNLHFIKTISRKHLPTEPSAIPIWEKILGVEELRSFFSYNSQPYLYFVHRAETKSYDEVKFFILFYCILLLIYFELMKHKNEAGIFRKERSFCFYCLDLEDSCT